MKQVQFGEAVYIEDGQNGWSSLDQTWWQMDELAEALEGYIQKARSGYPSETRGLESFLEKDADKESQKTKLYRKYIVLRYRKLAKMASGSKTSDTNVSVSLQEYASRQTKQNQLKAIRVARKDALVAMKINNSRPACTPKKSDVGSCAVSTGGLAVVNRCISC